jgi:hypothetical protein
VGERGETFGVRIEEDHGQRQRRQTQTQRIQFEGSEEQEKGGRHRKARGELRREHPGGDGAYPGARIAGVDLGIDEAIEGHRRRARRHHGHHDPQQLPPDPRRIEATLTKGEERSSEGEREGEDRVLELDHFEREAKAVPNHAETPLFYAMLYKAQFRERVGNGTVNWQDAIFLEGAARNVGSLRNVGQGMRPGQ